MGLMRVGRNEGAEIIQIFGRGIRPWKNHSLKRTSYLELSESEIPENIEILERLNVFGIKADYIKEFRGSTRKEDIPTGFVTKSVETVVDTDLVDNNLKVPRRREEVNYIDQTVSTLQVTDSHKPFVDLYPEVQTPVAARLQG